MLDDLERLWRAGSITDLDWHFVRLIARLSERQEPELLLAACLVSHSTGAGNVCVDLRMLAGRPILEVGDGCSITAPTYNRWIAVLKQSGVVGTPGEVRPMVLDQGGRLYLYRYWHYEQTLATHLLRRASDPPTTEVSLEHLRAGIARLFPGPKNHRSHWQMIAAAVAVLQRLTVISGGPGTGKTTTVTGILGLLIEQSLTQRPRIALAAPTGKAAARLQDAVTQATRHLALSTAVKESIPQEAVTIHRLLGTRSDTTYLRHHQANPLPLDVLVVDEASMVDVALMAKLVDALAPHARLILLGDKDQLASVEAGAVLGDLCAHNPGFSRPFSQRVAGVVGEYIAPGQKAYSPLRDCIILLHESFRFKTASGIGTLARIINAGKAEQVTELLSNGRFEDITWRPINDARALPHRLEEVIPRLRTYIERVRSGAPPIAVLTELSHFQVLCAHRSGPFGAERVNALIEQQLGLRSDVDAPHPAYPGRPVMVTRNDYNLGLFNGDLGVYLPDHKTGSIRAFFVGPDGEVRKFPPSRLPPHETVYAMTVHKAQGSEFNHVLLILPDKLSPITTRELLYTGISRARQSIQIWGTRPVLEAAMAQTIKRFSGLKALLWEASNDRLPFGSSLEQRCKSDFIGVP
jgi:exodeoxyribonuclease V alpha subunit